MKGSLRILVTAFDYRPQLGGIATCAFELARALSAKPGIEVRMLAPSRSGDAEFDKHEHFPTVRRPLPSRATLAVAPLARHIREEASTWKPDAILNTIWYPCGLATFMGLGLRRRARPPYFIMAHGMEILDSRKGFTRRLRTALAPIRRAVLGRARTVFAVSHFTKKLLVERCRVAEDNIHVIFNGVHPEEFKPGPRSEDLVRELGLQGKKILLTVTRLHGYKGVDRAISALRYVIARHPDVVYLVCGEGADRRRLESLAVHLGLREHVIFAGRVPEGRLRDYYNLAECFVLLSREDWDAPDVEGFGIVFLEAAACAKASIAGRSGGIPDAVADGETGWLVDPNSEYEISRAMLTCLEDADLLRRRGEAARERVLREFTWERISERLITELRSRVRD
jgi:phosphatidylinositol alpha-1,6-mannosyltransferase